MKNVLICGIAVLSLFMTGCATLQTGTLQGKKDIIAAKTAYVARHQKSTNNIELYIQEALTERGIQTKTGSDENIPGDVDIYVKYIDRWQWDMAMYLNSLKVMIYNAQTNDLLGSAEYRNSLFHTFPNPTAITKQVIDKIFAD